MGLSNPARACSGDMPAIRSSHSYPRYSPYFRPPTLVFSCPSPLANGRRLPSSSNRRSASRPPVSAYPQRSSISSSSSHITTTSTTGCPLVHPSPIPPQLIYAAQPSMSAPEVTGLARPPSPPVPRHPRPYIVMNATCPDPAVARPVHSPSSSQFIHNEQLSTALQPPEDLIYQNHPARQQPLQLSLGRVSSQQTSTYYGGGMFNKSHHLSFSDNTFIDNSTTSDNFMEKLLQQTIIGAEFDSSERYPPPRCHPGTRLAIVERCKVFIIECHGVEKMRWVVGPAGVGKSAIMQIVAEETPADASVFLSVNGRQDGTKTFTTIAYQLAAKYELYHQFVRKEVNRDPSLLKKSLPVQFQKFIVDAFIHQHLFDPSRRFLIIIDGLDECDNPLTQRKLLELISEFCVSYPTSPIVWFVASRPEPHITSFFEESEVQPAYTKEEIAIDSNEACEDVQRYLRDELNKIKLAYPTLKRKREWPSELEFTKIATAAGGLFAYASTVVRYIDDPYYQDPSARLRHVLEVIDASPKGGASGGDHPMAQLDALYKRILSNIPTDVMATTRKLLHALSKYGGNEAGFRSQCNRLELTEDAAYGAVRHIHAVVKVPAPDEADDEGLRYFHKSFADFLSDFKRSQFSLDVEDEVLQLQAQSSIRIVEQVPADCNGIPRVGSVKCYDHGYVKYGSRFCDNISLSWPSDERFEISDDGQRRDMYLNSLAIICSQFKRGFKSRWSLPCFHALTTRFTALGTSFPIYKLRDCAFDDFRSELTELGKLKQVPLRTLDYAAICGRIDFQFMSPIGMNAKKSDPWYSSCKHPKLNNEDKKGLQQQQGFSTSFERFLDDAGEIVAHRPADIPRFNIRAGKDSHGECTRLEGNDRCRYCSQRFAHYFINNPDRLAAVFVDSTELCYVELSFIDPDDDMSEWRYRFFHSGHPTHVD